LDDTAEAAFADMKVKLELPSARPLSDRQREWVRSQLRRFHDDLADATPDAAPLSAQDVPRGKPVPHVDAFLADKTLRPRPPLTPRR
jgi:hypothetical protein